MSSTVRYVSGDELLRLLPPQEALAAIQAFFRAHDAETVQTPPRIHLPVPGQSTVGLYMPAATAEHIGVKVVHLMPERFPSVQAEVFLYDAATGELLFWGDGKPMTALRTAAVSLAATLQLLPDCRTAVVYGAGVQAAAHCAALASAYPQLERVWAVTRSAESFARLQGALEPGLRERVQDCPDPGEALAVADCVITTTPAPAPLFAWEQLSPHCHVVGIGSATHAMHELPVEAFLQGRVWLDTRNAIEEAGDLRAAKAAGWNEADLAGDLFALLGHDAPAERPAGRTVFKSVGHAAQDLAVLVRLWERLQGGG